MINLIKNPLTIWYARLAHSSRLENKFKDKYLKIGFLSTIKNCTFGSYNNIGNNTTIVDCTLGDFTIIGSDTKISKTIIGKYCCISSDCKIGLGKHPTTDFVSIHPIFFSISKQAQITFSDQNYFNEYEQVVIGNDVLIGANVIVVDGVTIADGAIIAAGAVVTKNIPAYSIAGGVPARVIKYRFENNKIVKLLAIRWWDMDVDLIKNNFKKFHNIDDFLNYFSK